MRKFCSAFLVVLPLFGIAQAPVIAWQRCLGGTSTEFPAAVLATSDGGSLVAGYTESNDGDVVGHQGGRDAWVVKLDDSGNADWQKCIGGTANDLVNDIIEVLDGGFLMVGTTGSTDGDLEGVTGNNGYWLVRLDPGGNILWQKLYGGSEDEIPRSVIETADLGFLVVGSSQSSDGDVSGNNGIWDIWVVKVDAAGALQWEMNYGGSSSDIPQDAIKVNDGYIIAGSTSSNDGDVSGNNGGTDYWVIKIDQDGSLLWQRCFGGSGTDIAQVIRELSDGSIAIAGRSNSVDGDITSDYGMIDVWIVRIDPAGNLLWQKNFGGTGIDSYVYGLNQTSDGGLVFSADSNSADGDLTDNNGDYDLWLVKLDMSGNLEWQRSYGGSGPEYYFYLDVMQNDDLIVMGQTSSNDGDVSGNNGGWDLWVVKLNHDYNTIAGKVFADLNSNSIQDPNEPVLEHHMVSESLTQRSAFTIPSSGEYELTVLSPGVFPTSPASIPHYQAVPSEQAITFTGMWEEQSSVDFAFQPIGIANDLLVEVTPMTAFRVGFPAQYKITWKNVGTNTLTPTLVFEPHELLTFEYATLTPTSVYPDSIVWSLPSLGPFEQGEVFVHFNVSASANIGDQVISMAKILPVQLDAIPENNFSTSTVVVTAAYDPNDILVDRASIPINELPDTHPLDYTIRFQNTGNDTAFNVLLRNPLPFNVDRGSFTFVDASHDVVLALDNDNGEMRFSFQGIQLPDSNTNEALSHGFVRYRIQPLADLMVGDSILNQASIYFDFNEPIITNTAFTVVEAPTGISALSNVAFQMFPNPTNGILQIRTHSIFDRGSLAIHDVLGREVLQEQVNGSSHHIDLSGRPKGIYLVTLRSAENISTQRLILE